MVVQIPVANTGGRQLKLEFGFGTQGATNPDQTSGEADLERDMVTGDLNAAQVEWIVQYGISSPEKYLFQFRNPARGEALTAANSNLGILPTDRGIHPARLAW